jgi:glutaredoxin
MSVKYFIFTAEDCPRCERIKKEWKDNNYDFEERSADRLKSPGIDHDEIDQEGFVSLAQNNMQLPAIVILSPTEELIDGSIVTSCESKG